jgi:7,8-dihydropterin-6-yl-methyl-4-(beta-D-ribofuranosyl)aminobenzene 5'-phosphate synthase
MRVICVVDNTAQRGSGFWGEHGLAFLIKARDKRVLFDTGQSGTVLLHNLEVLEQDPAAIDALVLSHAHNDHAGGLALLLNHLRPGIPLHAHPDIFRERFSKKGGMIHNKAFSTPRQALENHFDFRLDAEPQEILPGVWTTGGITERPELEGRSSDHLMRESGELVPDAYRDDMAMVIQGGDRLTVLCGCCHAGLLNTFAHVERNFNTPIVYIAGGLHLAAYSEDQVQHVGEILSMKSTLQRVYPSHCTGEAAYVILSNMLGPKVVHPCPAGTELVFEG